jgi:hypothetical protein
MPQSIAFVDAGYLKAEGARTLGVKTRNITLEAQGCVTLLRNLAAAEPPVLLI